MAWSHPQISPSLSNMYCVQCGVHLNDGNQVGLICTPCKCRRRESRKDAGGGEPSCAQNHEGLPPPAFSTYLFTGRFYLPDIVKW